MGMFRNVFSVCLVVGSLSAFATLPMSEDLQGGVPCDSVLTEWQCKGGTGCPNWSVPRTQPGAANVIAGGTDDNCINHKDNWNLPCQAYQLPGFSGGCEVVQL